MEVFTPRVTDMKDGTHRPEIIMPNDVIFLEPMADADAACERACDVIELVPGDWTGSGRWYVAT